MDKILLVDDDIVVRTVTRKIVEKTIPGVTVFCSDCVKHAYESLILNNFSLLITDILMLDGKGTDLATTIRGDSKLYHLPIILMSSIIDEDNEIVSMVPNPDATSFLSKPLDPRELEGKINVCLNYWKNHKDSKRA